LTNEQPILIKDLKDVKQLSTGLDHILVLDKGGRVWAMGDDTFGQCGTGGEGRSSTAPFFEARHRRPM